MSAAIDPIQDREWSIVNRGVLRAQEDYLRAMKTPGAGDRLIRDAWLRLQGAEWRRDEFLAGSRDTDLLPASRRA